MSKRILLILVITLFIVGSAAYSQQWRKLLPETKKKSDLTLNDYKKAFYDYWAPFVVRNGKFINKQGKLVKAPGWKQFKRWEWLMESQVDLLTGEFPKTDAWQEFRKFLKQRKNFKATSANWVNIGTSSSDGGYAGIGRINCIAFHPTDNNTYWVGAPSGGVWVTNDNGTSWTSLSDDNAVLGVSDIIIPSDFEVSNTIYIATGDRDAWDNNSIGILKSSDGGGSWSPTGISYTIQENKMVNKLLLDPNDDQIIIAATSEGVYKTENGGASFTQLATNVFIDLEYKPGEFSVLYGCTTGGRVYYSVDGGTTWNQSNDLNSAGRVEIAVSPNQPDWVYAVAANGQGGLNGVYKSENSGVDFTLVFDNYNLLGWESDGGDDGGDDGGQGSYDLAIEVSPTDADIVLVGGINTWKSVSGGVTWSIVNHWSGDGVQAVHADKHNLRYRPNGDLFEVNDGGVYISSMHGANGSWVDKTNGLVISQIYRLGVSKSTRNKVIVGLQDNGSKLYSNGSWADVKGGDGMECLIDYTDDNVQYATYVNGQITRTKDGWIEDRIDINENIGDGTLEGAWVTPYIIDPIDHRTLYVGYADVWKTEDDGDSFTKISNINSSENLRSIAIAPSDNQTLYVADNSRIWRTTTGGLIWNEITGSLPTSSNKITYIAVHAANPLTLWVTMGGYDDSRVFKSVDGGDSWENISSGLPNIPVFTVVQDKVSLDNDLLYIGTDAGVFCKLGNNDWVRYSDGLPNVMVTELEIFYGGVHNDSKLRAATYGRGLWETPLFEVSNTLPYVTTKSITDINNTSAVFSGNISDIGQTSIIERGAVWGGEKDPTILNNKIADENVGDGEYFVLLDNLLTGTTFYVRAYATNSNGTSYGNNIEFKTTGIAAGVEDLNIIGVKIYPNPTKGMLNIEFERADYANKVVIRDLSGKIVLSERISGNRHAIDLSQVSKGIYLIELNVGSETVNTKIVLK
jgi:photosystem II stability/assembly factor-like uncharacterized protein